MQAIQHELEPRMYILMFIVFTIIGNVMVKIGQNLSSILKLINYLPLTKSLLHTAVALPTTSVSLQQA